MDNIQVQLKFETKQSGLAGNEDGQRVYREQIAPKIPSELANFKLTIIFPDYVQRIAISFVQGLTKELADRFGRIYLDQIVSFSTCDPELTAKITKDMVLR